jgi:hypothetical protein
MTPFPEPHVNKAVSFNAMLWLIFAAEFVAVYAIASIF